MLTDIETKGLVVIDSKPQGATIYLNDKRKGAFGKTPWQGSLESKPVRLILEQKGWKPEERAISPRSDKLIDVYIALSEEHYLGWVEIASNVPGADVFIDRKEIGAIGRTPFTGHLKPGKHTIFVERFGFDPRPPRHRRAAGHGDAAQLRHAGVAEGLGGDQRARRLGRPADHRRQVRLRDAVPHRGRARASTRSSSRRTGWRTTSPTSTIPRGVETTIEVQMSPRPPRTRAITTAVVAARADRRRRVRRPPVAAEQGRDQQRHQRTACWSTTTTPRFLRGKIEAIGADVLYGVGAIVAVTAVFGLFAHGPDSTGVADSKKISFAPTMGPDGGGFSLWGQF